MSEVETALAGAEVAPVENTAATPEQTQAQAPETTTEQVEAQAEQPRDEKGRFQPRINELTMKWRSTERELQAERNARAQLEQQLAQYRPQSQGQSTEAPPSLEDFGFDMGKWSQAMTDYAVTRATTLAEQRVQQQAQRQQQQTVEQQFQQRSQEYAKAHPDFDSAVDSLSQSVQFHPALVDAIGTNEHGPAIVHYLAQHLDEADAISRLPPHIAAVRLGRIEAQVSTTKPKPVTNAPNPPPTLGGGKATVTKNPDDMTLAEWTAWRNSSLKAKQGR